MPRARKTAVGRFAEQQDCPGSTVGMMKDGSMRWILLVLCCFSSTPSAACLHLGLAKTFDFVGEAERPENATWVIGEVLTVLPSSTGRAPHTVTLRVLKAYGREYSSATIIQVAAPHTSCGGWLAPGDIGLYAVIKAPDGLRLAYRRR